MGQIEVSSSTKMAKSGAAVKKASSSSSSKSKGKGVTSKSANLDLSDPKTQTILLVGILAVLALALWFGFTNGCLGRRRRRRSTC